MGPPHRSGGLQAHTRALARAGWCELAAGAGMSARVSALRGLEHQTDVLDLVGHGCPRTGMYRVYSCPCDRGWIVVCCDVCGEPLVVASARAPCEHSGAVEEL